MRSGQRQRSLDQTQVKTMTHHRQSNNENLNPAQPQNADDITQLTGADKQSGERPKHNGQSGSGRVEDPFLHFGPSWEEIHQEWYHGSRIKVIIWFALVSFFGWCLGLGINKMI